MATEHKGFEVKNPDELEVPPSEPKPGITLFLGTISKVRGENRIRVSGVETTPAKAGRAWKLAPLEGVVEGIQWQNGSGEFSGDIHYTGPDGVQTTYRGQEYYIQFKPDK